MSSGVFGRELAARLPAAEIGWRYRLVANGFSLSLPSGELPRLRTLSGVRDVLPAGSYAPQLSATPQQIGAPALWGQGARHRGTGREDRDHRLRDRRPPSLLRPDRLCDASGISEGPAAVYDSEGDRRAGLRAEERERSERSRRRSRDDDSSHGTHVAGIAAGNADTPAGGGRRVSGVAPRAYLGNYKVFVETDSGLSPNANSPAIVAAIETAVADGMDVINFSGGEPEIDPAATSSRVRSMRRPQPAWYRWSPQETTTTTSARAPSRRRPTPKNPSPSAQWGSAIARRPGPTQSSRPSARQRSR